LPHDDDDLLDDFFSDEDEFFDNFRDTDKHLGRIDPGLQTKSPGVKTTESPVEARDKSAREQEEVEFWIPQATYGGRLYYFNTLTGKSTLELPLR
jgi:hypothetical protein